METNNQEVQPNKNVYDWFVLLFSFEGDILPKQGDLAGFMVRK